MPEKQLLELLRFHLSYFLQKILTVKKILAKAANYIQM